MMERIQRNPFICGGSVPASYFVGREREVRTIFGQIVSPARGSVAISGDRRMGKTSLLQYIREPAVIESWGLSRDDYLFIYLDCPTVGSFAPTQFWRAILTRLLDEARGASLVSLMEKIQVILEKETIQQADFEIVLDEIHRAGRVLALLLDEFEWVIDPQDEHATQVFLSGLRALTTRQPRALSLVVATREELKRLCQPIKFPGSPFYNNFLFRLLKPFTEKEINQLIERTLEGTGIEFGPEERGCIQELGGIHPYLIQLAGALIFDTCAQGQKVAECSELITTGFEEQTRHHFAEVWEDSSVQEKMLLMLFALCGLAKQEKGRDYDVETIQYTLGRHERALRLLAERGLITEARSTATLSPPMFEAWVLGEIKSSGEREFAEYASLMFDLLGTEEAECAVEAMWLASERKGVGRESVIVRKIGRYEVIEELGRGAMSIVYKARDPNIGRLVALKVIRLSSGAQSEEVEEAKERFKREAMSAGQLKHPNIVAIHDADEYRGEPFIVMECLEGFTLARVIKTESPLALKRVINIVNRISDALDYAHRRGVIHRDIKPSNIFLLENDQIRVADFGLAKLTFASDLTQEGRQAYGTLGYASPEQWRGQRIDSRADIFSMGVVIYEMLTGKKPFEKADVYCMISRTVDEKPLDFAALGPDIPPDVKKVLLKATAKDVNQRYRTCAELAQDLEECLTPKKEGRPDMGLPVDQQLALTVLAQATQFLFGELGRRLDFWRKKKGEQATPGSVEPVSRPDGAVVRLDDLERQIDMQRLLSKKEDIEASMHIILEKKRFVGELRKQAANALTPPAEQARIKAGIKGIEDEIVQESNKLEALLKEVYGEKSE